MNTRKRASRSTPKKVQASHSGGVAHLINKRNRLFKRDETGEISAWPGHKASLIQRGNRGSRNKARKRELVRSVAQHRCTRIRLAVPKDGGRESTAFSQLRANGACVLHFVFIVIAGIPSKVSPRLDRLSLVMRRCYKEGAVFFSVPPTGLTKGRQRSIKPRCEWRPTCRRAVRTCEAFCAGQRQAKKQGKKYGPRNEHPGNALHCVPPIKKTAKGERNGFPVPFDAP